MLLAHAHSGLDASAGLAGLPAAVVYGAAAASGAGDVTGERGGKRTRSNPGRNQPGYL